MTELAESTQTSVPGSCVGCGEQISKPLEEGAGSLQVDRVRGVVIGAVVAAVVGVVGW